MSIEQQIKSQKNISKLGKWSAIILKYSKGGLSSLKAITILMNCIINLYNLLYNLINFSHRTHTDIITS